MHTCIQHENKFNDILKKKRQKKKPLRNDGRYFDRRWKSKESCEVIENLAICRG